MQGEMSAINTVSLLNTVYDICAIGYCFDNVREIVIP